MTLPLPARARHCLLAAALCLLSVTTAQAAPLLERIKNRLAPARTPVEMIKDLSYGSDDDQRFDVYRSEDAEDAPVIFMVHGGAWRLGSKNASPVVDRKVERWVPKGFIVVSVNYRMLPDADPLEQARDVAQALTTAQAQAADWGGDPTKFILMGHSAGAHLVGLIHASPVLATGLGAKPWLGAVLLDSAALDVVRVMEGKHPRFYDRAFGRDPGFWQATSPWHQVGKGAAPVLVVCSTQREDACRQADRYRDKAARLGARASVLRQDLSHGDVNARLGTPGAYTRSVEQFMTQLDPVVAMRLQHP